MGGFGINKKSRKGRQGHQNQSNQIDDKVGKKKKSKNTHIVGNTKLNPPSKQIPKFTFLEFQNISMHYHKNLPRI